jgi:SAM-dependent methyltransferase
MNDRLDPTMAQFQTMRETAARYYDEKIRVFGAVARGVDWKSEESQHLRFHQLLRLIDEPDLGTVNDYGCGYGAFASFLRGRGFRGRYAGFDISPTMIAEAIAAHAGDPLSSFTNDREALAGADYTFASGVFNVKQDHPSPRWQEYILATLTDMDRLSGKGFAFNMLSSYSDRDKQRSDLFYAEPGFYFDYCKTQFAKQVALLHDYPLYEFTIVVRK